MNKLIIFLWILSGFVCISFWVSSAEGKHGWARKFTGWRTKIYKNYELTRYHFWVCFLIFISQPLIIYGFNSQLLGIIISAWFLGWVIEDFLWFVVNPEFKFKDWNSKKVKWYPWLKFGKIERQLQIYRKFLGDCCHK